MRRPWSRSTHLSPREREDEDREHEREFGVQELKDEDERDRILRSSDTGGDDREGFGRGAP